MRPLLVLPLLVLAACTERRFAGPPPEERAASPAGTEATSTVAAAPSGGAGVAPAAAADDASSWRESVRLERWAEAAARIDALPENVRAHPELRYVRARAAVGVGDGATAIALLDGLEPALPLLAGDIARWRAEAQLLSGPYAPAAAYFSRSHSAADLTRAAEAYAKAGDVAAARATADRAVAAASRGKTPREEAAARTKRAELSIAQGSAAGNAVAELDLRWVTAHAAGTAEGRAAAAMLDRITTAGPPSPPAHEPPKPASPPAQASAAPAAASPAPRPAVPPLPPLPAGMPRGEALHARAMALFRARDNDAAARAFHEAFAAHGAHEAEDLHLEARSLARADRDEEALKLYRQVALRYPRSAFAEKSAYFAARIDLQAGRFAEAAQEYTRYLATYRKGEHREESVYERALAWLSDSSAKPSEANGLKGHAAQAWKELEALVAKAHDDRAARLRELEGVAAFRMGDREAAVATWTDLALHQPLTWAALTSRARLAEAGAPVPPWMPPDATVPHPAPVLDLRLPPGPALLASLGLDGDAESLLSTEEREALAQYPGHEGEALCGLYGLLSRAKRRYRVGIHAVDGSLLQRAPSPGERWAWDCVYPRPFASGVHAIEEENGLPRDLVYAVMRQESGFDPSIVSPASAVGLMQLMPATAKQAATELSLPFDEADLTRPDVNLRLGAFYIAKLLKMFQGSVALAAAAYNAGPRAVSRWLSGSADRDLDLWVARIPYEETRTYVARVGQNLMRYQWLEGGDATVDDWALTLPADAQVPPDAY